ncbi:hypothetical protein [Chromobacterium sp. IIBBL 290-4]|uniref:hypothetical protein n=1 Tax=Chromobacterium sp. IIBBL 290-4 TaxID=2953890 RepID=UPI0020B71B27|nr:hypothetical protein [Chromobacterium sp. IIBBL 290-4]UTH74675.1 hypothetical protein NKT35_00735 [Chromobacterium sp. IIBBL 290-4]
MIPEISLRGRVLDRKIQPVLIVFNAQGLSARRNDVYLWRVRLEEIASVRMIRGRRLFGLFPLGWWLVVESRGGECHALSGVEFDKGDLALLVERINDTLSARGWLS